ncbi:hypothetical protein [Proteiniphilum sp. X52]|uniref:hypothetical protein n=1 Tax=Proteiniphilum sp. X52 TaxID=2382159 RepID=UPI0011CEB41D|nr:hypothetical protein [Proteiniphilum sp. X52]
MEGTKLVIYGENQSFYRYTTMNKKEVTTGIQFLMAFILYLFSVSCEGPLAGEEVKFLTPNVYKDLPPEATRIEMKTENRNWTFQYVQYNDTIVDLSTGNINKIEHGKVTDPSFSYDTKTVNNRSVTEIKGSFFSIISESPGPRDKNEPTVITVDLTENRSKEKRVLLVQLISLDTGGYFRIEQNPK